MAREQNAEAIDLKLMDLIGTWQHFSIPLSEFAEDIFPNGEQADVQALIVTFLRLYD